MQGGLGTDIVPAYGGGKGQLVWERTASERGSQDSGPGPSDTQPVPFPLFPQQYSRKGPALWLSVVSSPKQFLTYYSATFPPAHEVRTCSILKVGNQRPAGTQTCPGP